MSVSSVYKENRWKFLCGCSSLEPSRSQASLAVKTNLSGWFYLNNFYIPLTRHMICPCFPQRGKSAALGFPRPVQNLPLVF